MVSEEGLSKSWIDIIYRTAERISTYVRPDIKQEGDDMDVRKYVHFKKVTYTSNFLLKAFLLTSDPI